jgi:hypothetical protein
VAHDAAARRLKPILEGISNSDPFAREQACTDLDEVLKDQFGSGFDNFKSADRDFDSGKNGPYQAAISIVEPQQKRLAQQCDWERKDAQAERDKLEQNGRAILNGMSPSDRKDVEDSYYGR